MAIKAYILLGSNLENPQQQVKAALQEVSQIPETSLNQCSILYYSKPISDIPQPNYINAVAELETELTAHELLDQLHAIEKKHGRVRETKRWGPRTLDLDLLLYGDKTIHTASLIVPHPEMKQRNFVLIPLAELAPDLVLPTGESLKDLVASCSRDGLVPCEKQ